MVSYLYPVYSCAHVQVFNLTDADDPVMRATLAIKLAVMQRDQGDLHGARSTIRKVKRPAPQFRGLPFICRFKKQACQ